MFGHLLKTEWMKLKNNWIVFPILLAPLLILLLQYANFLIRYSSVVKEGDVPWTIFIEQHSVIWAVLILPILAAVLSSMLIMTENSENNWKYLLVLPIKRGDVYFAKIILVIFFLSISTLLLAVGMVISSMALNLPGDIPFGQLIQTLGAALIGSFAVLTIQFWLSIHFNNPGVPLAVAICGTVAAIFLLQSALTRWLPWVYPYLVLPIRLNEGINIIWYMVQSLLIGLLCLGAGYREFARRDI
ncbi:ABC transporter permease [Metabacillus arenae]|uniref:ABC transporter permease n=1 Tax=Metabacillus arenae TaxID=2771434 RepID=A0A926NSN2_9BACI|nr:ABC transporter permease [Metabacillus arenae]MBD1383217.1 ABC transporter permease [Metabacillus arenae]